MAACPIRTCGATQREVEVELSQAGEVGVTATAMTVARRETWCGDDEHKPAAPAPNAVPDPIQSPRVEWVRCDQMRFIESGMSADRDDSGSNRRNRLWMLEPSRDRLTSTASLR